VPNPFDTGIRLTVVNPEPTRVRCDVDEFVLCPTNARADEWQRLAEAEAREHLATAKRLVEAEVALAQAERARDHAQTMQQMAEAFHDVAVKERDLARAEAARLRKLLTEACDGWEEGQRSAFIFDRIDAIRTEGGLS